MILDGRKMKFASRKQLNQQKKAWTETHGGDAPERLFDHIWH